MTYQVSLYQGNCFTCTNLRCFHIFHISCNASYGSSYFNKCSRKYPEASRKRKF
jgi:hypothetical protein